MNNNCKPDTLLVIPVYNHGDSLLQVVQQALDAGWPVLVVDDGSTDNGTKRLSDLPCRVHRLNANRGKGAAILAGASLADEMGYGTIITIDADGQHDPVEARRLLDAATADQPVIVIGARRMDGANVPKASLFGRDFSNFWVRLECGLELPDTQSGMRLYPVKHLLGLPLRCRRYDFEVEVLVRTAWTGIPIRSVSVSVHYPPKEARQSHFHQLKDNFRLTLLHTGLVLRALSPVPHKRLTPPAAPAAGRVREDAPISFLHPIRLLKRICMEHTSALQLAVAVWMGFFLGALPTLGIHTVLVIYVSHKLHLNKVAGLAANQFCCPPFVPALCIEVGYFMRTGHLLLDISWETLVLQLHLRLWDWFLGSLLVGPALGLIGGALTYFGVRRLRQRKGPSCEPAVEQ